MTSRLCVVTGALAALLASACAMDRLGTGGAGTSAATDAGPSDGGGTVTGAGCGAERQTGIQLCAATSRCPNLVVDTQAMPSCGFRIRGSSVDLVCACASSICPMGIFATCAEAAKLLTSQTEQQVCLQVGEDRCTEVAALPNSAPPNGNPACDRDCMARCGGGAACAAVCNCD